MFRGEVRVFEEEGGALRVYLIPQPLTCPVSGKAAFHTHRPVVVCSPLCTRGATFWPRRRPASGAGGVGTTPAGFRAVLTNGRLQGKLEGQRNSWSFEAGGGHWGTWGTVDCHLFAQARLLPPCLGHPGRQGASRSEATLSPRRRAGGWAPLLPDEIMCLGFAGLRPHSCVSVLLQPSQPHPRSPGLLGTEWGLAALSGS